MGGVDVLVLMLETQMRTYNNEMRVRADMGSLLWE